MNPEVMRFRDTATSTFTHVMYARDGGSAAVVDPDLGDDAASAQVCNASAERVLALLTEHCLHLDWILKTHAHADHLTAVAYLRRMTNAKVAIGRGIASVQARFQNVFDLGPDFVADGHQSDRLCDDGDIFDAVGLTTRAIATPGHTADSLTYLIGDPALVGDTFVCTRNRDCAHRFSRRPRVRAASLQPRAVRVASRHTAVSVARRTRAQTSIQASSQRNVHVGKQMGEQAFLQLRTAARDAQLPVPWLMLPALQMNIRAGELPPFDLRML